MKNESRRQWLKSSALLTTGAVAGCVTPTVAQNEVKTPFKVAQVTLPVVGSSEVFPVRRIY
ncbi:MAG: FAA hydrolase family protein, partial [Burkholderiales bacterium]